MVNVGDTVHHIKFGAGLVNQIDEAEGKINIEFDKKKILSFPYPGAFDNFLSIDNGNSEDA